MAPDSSPRASSERSLKAVKIRTAVSGACSRICFVASRPSMPGMRTSMITTSGLRRSTSATALLAVGRLADHADVRRAREREPKPLADDLVVVDDQARDLLRHARDHRVGCWPSHAPAPAARPPAAARARTPPPVADAVPLRASSATVRRTGSDLRLRAGRRASRRAARSGRAPPASRGRAPRGSARGCPGLR